MSDGKIMKKYVRRYFLIEKKNIPTWLIRFFVIQVVKKNFHLPSFTDVMLLTAILPFPMDRVPFEQSNNGPWKPSIRYFDNVDRFSIDNHF